MYVRPTRSTHKSLASGLCLAKRTQDKLTDFVREGGLLVATLAPETPYRPGNGIGKVAHVPHALNPLAFTPDADYDDRPIRVGFRGIRYPDILGDTERNDAVSLFADMPQSDVAWGVFQHPMEYAQWLRECKATVATEAGAPGMKAVSSRHFDSIGSGTALIMTPGDYSGCLTEDHYVRLDRDHGNLTEVMERIDDESEWRDVTTRALSHVLEHHTYAHRMAQLDELLWH